MYYEYFTELLVSGMFMYCKLQHAVVDGVYPFLHMSTNITLTLYYVHISIIKLFLYVCMLRI